MAALVVALIAPAAAFADAKDAVLNKEGFWGIDVDRGACAASMTLQGGAVFLLRAQKGHVTFGLFGKRPYARGKAGRIETEAYGFDFAPTYGEDAATLYTKVDLDERALAALRLARQVRIVTDGQTVASMTFEGTGFEGALDGVIACSKGESGWWGKGVGGQAADRGAPPPAAAKGAPAPKPVLNKEGVWALGRGEVAGLCIADASVDDRSLQVGAGAGRIGLLVESHGKPLERGAKGLVTTDSYSFEFKPDYLADGSLSTHVLDSQAVFALHRAKWIRISVDGHQLIDVDLKDTGFPDLLDAALACARGEKGWWGEGALAR